jgi:hypothetical protein
VLQTVCGIGRHRIGDRDAHHHGHVLLTDVLHQEVLDGLPLALAEHHSAAVEVFDVEQGVDHPVGTTDDVYALGLVEGPERHQVLEQGAQYPDRK